MLNRAVSQLRQGKQVDTLDLTQPLGISTEINLRTPALLPDAEDIQLKDIDHIPDSAIPPQTREMMRNLIVRLGQGSFKQAYQRLREFRVDDDGLRRIRCPALALVGTGEGAEPLAQAEHFMHAVGGPVMRHVFSAEEGADGHCQTGNLAYSAAVSMDWLDELFGN